MHALFITFASQAAPESLSEPFEAYAHALHGVEGLVSKTWIADGPLVGGFYVFARAVDVDNYLSSTLWASVRTNPAFSGFEIRQFGVLDELTAVTSSVGAGRHDA